MKKQKLLGTGNSRNIKLTNMSMSFLIKFGEIKSNIFLTLDNIQKLTKYKQNKKNSGKYLVPEIFSKKI